MLTLTTRNRMARPTALLLSVSMVVPTILAGCGGAPQQTAMTPPPGMENPRNAPVAQPRQGMSTGKKVALLAGAAALYYIYKKRQAAQQEAGPNGKYFLSKNGRVYYRNLKTGDFQWVSPPRQPIQVPMDEAAQYQEYAGFNNRSNGRSFGGYGPGQQSYNDAEPAYLPQSYR